MAKGIIKVKNKGNQIFIGKKLCPTGKVTPVDEKDLYAFCKTPGGAALLDSSLFVYEEDFKKKKAASSIALKQQAEADVRQELTPVLEKEIRAKLKKKYDKKIEELQGNVDDLMTENHGLKLKIEELKKTGAVTDDDKDTDDSKEFVFDPENHLIAHRGGGKYFVMDLEDKKLHGPLTEDEKTEFEAMQKAE